MHKIFVYYGGYWNYFFLQLFSSFIIPITYCVFLDGVIRLLEETLQRPFHWFACMFHANELPLRHLLAKLDDKTVGPRSFARPIGKLLASCENLAIVKLEPTANFNLDIDPSTDQMYLYEICWLISSGIVPESLSKRHPGNISHARWLTTANRLLRLYVAT